MPMLPSSLLFHRPGRQYVKLSVWKNGAACFSHVHGMQAEMFKHGGLTRRKSTSSHDVPSRASPTGGAVQRGWHSLVDLLTSTKNNLSHFQLSTAKLWRSTRSMIYKSTWMYPGQSMATYYFGRATVLGKLLRSNCLQRCMLNQVAPGNVHSSTSCIASHCTAISADTVKAWGPSLRCSSATLRPSVHTHHSSISMTHTICMTSLAQGSLVCLNRYTCRNVSPRK